MGKYYISLLFLICVMVFMIPSKHIGLILYQNLLTEEQALYNMDNDDMGSTAYISLHSVAEEIHSFSNQSYQYPHQFFILSRYSDDINTPPPNI